MRYYCLKRFKEDYNALLKKKSYSCVESELYNYFFGKTVEQLKTGANLNNSPITPYIKKRLKGRGGFRLYFLLIIIEENLYLMHIHPKTGSMGKENITDDEKKELYKEISKAIKSNNLLEVEFSNNKLTFSEIKVVKEM